MAISKSLGCCCMFLANVFFIAGTIMSLVGLLKVDWMTFETSLYEDRIGLLKFCKYIKSVDVELCEDTSEYSDYIDEIYFIAARIFVIAGIGLGFFAALVGFIFMYNVNRMGRISPEHVRGVFIGVMICAISSAVCLGLGLYVFGNHIYRNPYELSLSFILTCVGAVVILIGCLVFPAGAVPLMAQNRAGLTNENGVVMTPMSSTAPQGYPPAQPYTVYNNQPGYAQVYPPLNSNPAYQVTAPPPYSAK